MMFFLLDGVVFSLEEFYSILLFLSGLNAHSFVFCLLAELIPTFFFKAQMCLLYPNWAMKILLQVGVISFLLDELSQMTNMKD